jgi:acyl-CoA thioesterase FadM
MVIKGAWINVGEKSMTHEQRMFEADNGILCAIQTTVEVRFNMKTRKSVPLTKNIKSRIENHLLSQEKLEF